MSNSTPAAWVSVVIIMVGQQVIAQPADWQMMPPDEAHVAAIRSLDTFKGLAAPDKLQTLGLEALGQASNSSLGAPIQDYMIRLDELKTWNGDDPAKLLRPTGRWIYPISAEGKTRSSVTLAKNKGRWAAVAFGAPDEAQARSRIRDQLAGQAPGGDIAATIQVRVPALNATFIARQQNGQMQFTPIRSVARLGLDAGKTEPAAEILLRIQPAARQIDENMPN